MRILFDGHYWLSGPPSGQMVVQSTVLAWRREFPDDQLLIALPRDPTASEVTVFDAADLIWIRRRLALHPLSNFVELPRLARQVRADWIVAQNFTPATGRSATFIHDVLFQSNPEWFTARERLYLAGIPRLARRADIVFTSSHSEAARICRLNPLLARRAPVVTGLAPSEALLEANPTRPPGLEGEPGSFLLSVGRLNSRKNLRRAVLGALDARAISPECPFVLVGEPNGRNEASGARFDDAVETGAVRYTGKVTWDELAWLYSRARRFVYLSLDEGYGLPPVEALAWGCEVIVSDIPVMREVVGDRGEFVDPRDDHAIVDRMRKIENIGARQYCDAITRESDWPLVVRTMRTSLTTCGSVSGRGGTDNG